MIAELKGKTVPIKLWAPVEEIESVALDQLRNVAALPWVAHHVAVMPDVHVGTGATVGSVIAMRGAVAPAAVGVDIGCGMVAVKTSLGASLLPDDLKHLRLDIEGRIPVGRCQHAEPVWRDSPLAPRAEACLARFSELEPEVQRFGGRVKLQLGTLGGGNH